MHDVGDCGEWRPYAIQPWNYCWTNLNCVSTCHVNMRDKLQMLDDSLWQYRAALCLALRANSTEKLARVACRVSQQNHCAEFLKFWCRIVWWLVRSWYIGYVLSVLVIWGVMCLVLSVFLMLMLLLLSGRHSSGPQCFVLLSVLVIGGVMCLVLSVFLMLMLLLSAGRHSSGPQCCSCCSCSWGSCCYQISDSLRICRFSTDRHKTFHTY